MINIFTLTIYILFVLSGYYMGKLLGFYFGDPGWIIGFIVGASLFSLVYYLIIHYWNKWFPDFPPCKDCQNYDYTEIDYDPTEGSSIYSCPCGKKYFRKLPYFKELLS